MTLRVLSYNIFAGGEGRLSQLTRVIQSQRPDVVALLEARSCSHAEVLARALHSTEPGYTYKLPTPGLRLDYIFASPALAQRLSACDLISAGEAETASDHYPIWAEFLAEIALYPPVKKAS